MEVVRVSQVQPGFKKLSWGACAHIEREETLHAVDIHASSHGGGHGLHCSIMKLPEALLLKLQSLHQPH